MAINNRFESNSSAEQQTSKRGDDYVENASYRQLDKPTGMQSTETRTDKSTEKSTGNVYQVDQDSTEAAYQEQPRSRPDGHRSGLRTTS